MAKKKKEESFRPVFWIAGNYHDCRKTFQAIVQRITSSLGEPNIVSVECGFNPQDAKPETRVAQAGDIRRLLRMRDIFDSRPRIIRMIGLPPDYAEIADYLKYVKEDNVLVIDSPIGYYKQGSFVSAGASNFYKQINAEGKVFNFESRAENAKSAVDWLTKIAKSYNRQIETSVLQFLVEVKGLDFDTLFCELTKLFDYKAEEISIEDVKECSIPIFDRTVWELLEKLNFQKFDEACVFLEQFFLNLETIPAYKQSAAVEQLLGALNQNFELLVHAKDKCQTSFAYQPFWEALDGLTKLRDNEWVEKFSKGLCFAKLKDDGFQAAFRWHKSRIYSSWLLMRSLHPKIRFDSSNVRCGLLAICMHICGKLGERESLILGGYSSEEADELIKSG